MYSIGAPTDHAQRLWPPLAALVYQAGLLAVHGSDKEWVDADQGSDDGAGSEERVTAATFMTQRYESWFIVMPGQSVSLPELVDLSRACHCDLRSCASPLLR